MEFGKNEDIEKIIKHINNKIKNRDKKIISEAIKPDINLKKTLEGKIYNNKKKFQNKMKILGRDEITILKNTNKDLRLIILQFQEKLKKMEKSKKNEKQTCKKKNSILEHKKFINSKLLEEKKKNLNYNNFYEKDEEIRNLKKKNSELIKKNDHLKQQILKMEKNLPTKETQNLLIKFKEDNKKLFFEKHNDLIKIEEKDNFINKLNEILKNKDKNILQLEKDYMNAKKKYYDLENQKKINLKIFEKEKNYFETEKIKFENEIKELKKIQIIGKTKINKNFFNQKIIDDLNLNKEKNNQNLKNKNFEKLDFLKINSKKDLEKKNNSNFYSEEKIINLNKEINRISNEKNKIKIELEDLKKINNLNKNENHILIKNLTNENYYENNLNKSKETNLIKNKEILKNEFQNEKININKQINLEEYKNFEKSKRIFEIENKNLIELKKNLEDSKKREIILKNQSKNIEVFKKEIEFYKKENLKLKLINQSIKDNKNYFFDKNKEILKSNFVLKFRSDINSQILDKKNNLKIFDGNFSQNKILSAFHNLKKENEELKGYVKEISDVNSRNVSQIHLLLEKISEYE